MHSAKACRELLPISKGLAAKTTQELSIGTLLKTIPGPFAILNPPPITNSSELQVAILCATSLKATICPGTFLTARFIVGAAAPGGPMGPCSPDGPGGPMGHCVPFCPGGPW